MTENKIERYIRVLINAVEAQNKENRTRYTVLRLSTAATREIIEILKEQEAVEPKLFQSDDFLYTQWYICGVCGCPIDPGDKFCRECGRPIKPIKW